jgi:organic hydroperoxide reductase OsmC/OhrA
MPSRTPIRSGGGQGPNASRLLAAAVGNCLSASALLCLRKARIEVRGMRTMVRTTARNEEGRLRISRIQVDIEPDAPVEEHARMARCLDLFENVCVVTESVRGGIDVQVAVTPVDAHQERPEGVLRS